VDQSNPRIRAAISLLPGKTSLTDLAALSDSGLPAFSLRQAGPAGNARSGALRQVWEPSGGRVFAAATRGQPTPSGEGAIAVPTPHAIIDPIANNGGLEMSEEVRVRQLGRAEWSAEIIAG
jgi:hypothetical protein